MDVYVPLDPRPDACEITEMSQLRSAEVGVTVTSLTVKEIKSLAIEPKTYIIGEIDYANARLSSTFIVGDQIIKVNDTTPSNFPQLTKLLANSGDTTVIVKRRAFISPPGPNRIQAAMTALKVTIQKKYAYHVVNCKKMPFDIFLTTSFGFTAESIAVEKKVKKFIVAEINGNTAAEKYFSVGDILIDFRGVPVLQDGQALKQFNTTFQSVGEIDVLVERPVTVKSREAIATLIKPHLLKHDTPAMCDEVTKIGLLAARYHNMLWRRLTPVPITTTKDGPKCPTIPDVCIKQDKEKPEKNDKTAGTPDAATPKRGTSREGGRTRGSAETRPSKEVDGEKKSKPKKKDSKKVKNTTSKKGKHKKSQKRKRGGSIESIKTRDRSEETKDVSVDATSANDRDTTVGDNESGNNHVKIVGAKSFQEITSDVEPGTELESVGLRYTDDFEDENTADDEEQKNMKRARRALRPIKKGLFSTMALFVKTDKKDKDGKEKKEKE